MIVLEPGGDSRAATAPLAVALCGVLALVAVVVFGLAIRGAGNGPLTIDTRWHDLVGVAEGSPAFAAAVVLARVGSAAGVAACGTIIAALSLYHGAGDRSGAGRRRWRDAGALITALLLGVAASESIKLLIARPRPPDALLHPAGLSYPSGHSMGAAILVVSVVLIARTRLSRAAARWAAATAAAWLGVMMWSRAALQVHWLTDTLAGALLGLAAVALAHAIWGGGRGSAAPERGSDEGAVPPVQLALPFSGTWLVQNSPARRVPSHGLDAFGQRYAIDFVAVDARRRSAPTRDWRTVVSTEPPERFYGFGRTVLSPADGVVVAAHDGEADHDGRRSQLSLLRYMAGQGARLRAGVPAVAGNHLIIRIGEEGPFIALVHLRRGSIRVAPGDRLSAGDAVAECGNSGNSTQPHLHLQAMDGPDPRSALGVPVEFLQFSELPRGRRRWLRRGSGVPDEGSVVEASPGGPGS